MQWVYASFVFAKVFEAVLIGKWTFECKVGKIDRVYAFAFVYEIDFGIGPYPALAFPEGSVCFFPLAGAYESFNGSKAGIE